MATMCPPAASLRRVLALSPSKETSKKFSVCPKCAYSLDDSGRSPVGLPAGINSTLLLDNSPTPQLLLSESNVIVYANNSAARVLKLKPTAKEAAKRNTVGKEDTSMDAAGRSQPGQWSDDRELSAMSDANAQSRDTGTGLEGRMLDELNIDLAERDMTRWVSLMAVYTNVKLNLSRRDQKRKERADHADDDMYGESAKWNYDYYGEQEKAKLHGSSNPDSTLRDTLPIVVMRADGEAVTATMYISLVDPYSTGYSYSAVSIIPGVGLEDATFTEQVVVRDEEHIQKASQRMYRPGHNRRRVKKERPIPENVAGNAGEDMMRRTRKLKDLILDEMDYAFIALSADGDIVITNEATREVFGKDALEASMGDGFEWIGHLNIWRPDFSEPLPFQEWALNRLLTERKPINQQIGLWAGDTALTVELRGKCIYVDEKKEDIAAALALVVDQTEWFAKEKQLRSMHVAQEAFLTNVSRKLKTPLAGIIGLLDLLYGSGKFSKEQTELIRQVFSSVNVSLLVVNDIVDFLKIQAGELTVARNAFVLQDLVGDLKVLFEQSMSKDDVKFFTDFAGIDKSAFGDGTRLLLLGDDSKIRRICINLLTNAFKFTPKGVVTMKCLTQKVQRNSLEVKFEIRDTGIGKSLEDQEKLFKHVGEVVGSSEQNESSEVQGFGLNIAKKFTSLLAGDIGISDSSPGRGSTFWFTVPCGRPSPDSNVKLPPHEDMLSKEMGVVIQTSELEPAVGAEVSEDAQAQLHIEGTNVLLVEDNWSHQLVMQKRLRKIGCNVLSAVNGQDALDNLKKPETEVDLIFTDLQMPLLDGFEATQRIRRDPDLMRFRAVPVIGVTATDSKGEREKAARCGIDEFTLKPLSDRAIRSLIERLLDPVQLAMRRKVGL